jgi:hypothetical protein
MGSTCRCDELKTRHNAAAYIAIIQLEGALILRNADHAHE